MSESRVHPGIAALFVLAALVPSAVAYNVSPSPTFLNQALAFALWGAVALPCLRGARLLAVSSATTPLVVALGVLAGGAALSVWGPGSLPASLGWSAIASVLAAAVLVAAGGWARAGSTGKQLFAAFCWAWVGAGVFNALIAVVQVFLPDLCDGVWIAASGYPGRAVGNLRQPNHLSSLLLWSCIATVGLLELGRLRRWLAVGLLMSTVFAVVLTASRTGLVSVLLLAVWGLLDRRLCKPTRLLLLAAPLMYAVSWLAMAQWASASQHSFGGSARLAESDISSSRFAIWRDTLDLIRMQPWSGVGFGEFNFAWTLTPFPQRPVAFFDHTHSLPLQLAVELGLPLAALVLALLGWALWRGLRNAWSTGGDIGTAQRCAMLMVLMIGLHSLLEYPLWYSYFLLPAAWAWGFALQPSQAAAAEDASSRSRVLPVAAWLVVFGTVLSVVDYWRVVVIFEPGPDAGPLEQRIAAGQRSIFFAHHADYAAVTSGVPSADPQRGFDRATHYLLDTRLMIAWAKSLAARGEVDAARHVAARLREFRKPDAEEFFAPCVADAPDAAAAASAAPAASAAAIEQPFQCEPPQQPHTWQEFLPRR